MSESSSKSGSTLTVDGLLRSILKLGLIERSKLQSALRSVALNLREQPQAIADHLSQQGLLTPFQARKLITSHTRGLVLGPYHVLRPIGRGGMSVVYLARDQRSGNRLALKILPPHRARAEERLLERFRREMEICQRVSHRNLVWVHEVGLRDGIYYIAMEHVPGKSLHRLVADDKPLSVARAAHLMCEVASALSHAHDQGYVHRDLKPSNILVTPNDHAKVLDLGFALMEGETGGDIQVVGGQGYVVGTMDYIAPEQIEDPTKVDGRTDLYSLGCTLYYALSGQPPFPGGNSREKMQRHLHAQPEPIRNLHNDLPADFSRIVARLMEKCPDKRYASAAEVEDVLRPWGAEAQVLPLDDPHDPTYAQVVAELELMEAPEELELADEELFDDDEVFAFLDDEHEKNGRPAPLVTVPAAFVEPIDQTLGEFLFRKQTLLVAAAAVVVVGLILFLLLK